MIQVSWNAFSISWKFLAVRVFLEVRRVVSQTSARQMLHPEDGRSGAGDAFLCVATACPRGATAPSSPNTAKNKKVRNWRQGAYGPCRVMASETTRQAPRKSFGGLRQAQTMSSFRFIGRQTVVTSLALNMFVG